MDKQSSTSLGICDYAKITNDSRQGKGISIEAGDRFMQTIFIPYGITYSETAEAVRNSGCGSTGR